MSAPRQTGFTLLEMLVAVAVLGLLSLGILRGLALGNFSWTRAQHSAADAKRVRDARRLLGDLIADAIPSFAYAALDDHRIAFAGAPQELDFVTRQSASLGAPVPVAARLVYSAPDQTLTLYWRLDLPRADGGGPLPESRRQVAAHLADLRFAYFGAPSHGADPTWQDRWTDQTALPSRVRLTFADADGRTAWPTLVIEPRATANTACQFDPTDLVCAR